MCLCNCRTNKCSYSIKPTGYVYSSCGVHHSSADADWLIVLTELEVADTCAASVGLLLGEDTDLNLIPLTVASDPEKYITIIMPGRKLYSSAALRSALGAMVDSTLFVHAATDCETTSAVYRKGAGEMLSPCLTPICSLILFFLPIVTRSLWSFRARVS